MTDKEKAIAVLERHFSHERVFTPSVSGSAADGNSGVKKGGRDGKGGKQ